MTYLVKNFCFQLTRQCSQFYYLGHLNVKVSGNMSTARKICHITCSSNTFSGIIRENNQWEIYFQAFRFFYATMSTVFWTPQRNIILKLIFHYQRQCFIITIICCTLHCPHCLFCLRCLLNQLHSIVQINMLL
jgi:hypothetical protein